jgi:signal transduction histidine kinase
VIEIEDDGEGIPEQDRQAILEGQEPALCHASGVGLWLSSGDETARRLTLVRV